MPYNPIPCKRRYLGAAPRFFIRLNLLIKEKRQEEEKTTKEHKGAQRNTKD
jgi:hypothetical protein